ncbi:MAG: benzylsuccinate CoA-transferase BbsF subunit [Paraglaciecola psychrophila]|jgi:benzylsuccinate CoA-transferase BbsF subunit
MKESMDDTGSKPMNSANNRPMEGLKILDFTHVLAGPFATRILADMGADVVKINSVDRAVSANEPAHPYYLMWNRNKRALALDLTQQASRTLCAKLCREADVVIDNFSVGVLDRWGLGYNTISKDNAGVVYVQMSGMGEGGPWEKFVTYAPTIQALSGLTHLTGVPGRENIGLGFSYNDHQAGLHGAVALLAALEARRNTGRGQRVDLSQFEVGVNFTGPTLLDYFANDVKARATGNRLPYDDAAPHGCYRCAGAVSEALVDERWVAIACMNDQQWQAFKTLMGNPQWAEDPALTLAAGRVAQIDLIDREVGHWTAQYSAEDIMQRCQHAGVPAGVVQNGIDLVESDPQLQHSDFLKTIGDDHPRVGTTYADSLPLHFQQTPCEDYQRVREVGEDNEAVLKDWLAMSDAEIKAAADADLLR